MGGRHGELAEPDRPGGSRGLEDYFTRDFTHNIGAEIMGRNKFSPLRGPWQDEEWKGWWGEEPPFHTPVLRPDPPRPAVVHPRRHDVPLVSGEPADVLSTAREAADGKDVRLGGGATTVREFLDADLVDTLHVVVCPVELGSGARLWTSPAELDDRFHRDEIARPDGFVQHLLWHR